MPKSKRKIKLADGPLMKLSFMRLTKILGEDRASISEPKGHLKKKTSLLKIFNYRIIPIKEDSSNKIIEQLFKGLETNIKD